VAYFPALEPLVGGYDIHFEVRRGGSGGTLNWIRRLEDWSPLVLYTALMAAVSTIPTLTPPGDGPFSDKVWHVGEYVVWTLLIRRAIDRSRSDTSRRPFKMAATFVLGCILAVADENIQRLAGRHYAVDDMVADGAGLALGLPIYELIAYRVRAARRETSRSPADPSREGSTR